MLVTAGALYLVWLGAGLILRAGRHGEADGERGALPGTALGMAAFQFLNPKCWVLVLTAAAAMARDTPELGRVGNPGGDDARLFWRLLDALGQRRSGDRAPAGTTGGAARLRPGDGRVPARLRRAPVPVKQCYPVETRS